MSITTAGEAQATRMPRWMPFVPIAYIAVLSGVAFYFNAVSPLMVFGLKVPLTVLWFGALGGAVASLQGIFMHSKAWRDQFDLWHYYSGIVGAVYGLVSYLFLIVITKSATGDSAQIDGPLFALGAFALGYGQNEFHAMMTQVFTVLFQPGRGTSTKSDLEQRSTYGKNSAAD